MNLINPKVTVRMPAYNHADFVEQAVLSIINQTYQDFELIVIDDGSTDRTPQILERLSQEHGFHFERQENMGLTKTLNKITLMARGKYLADCASDDAMPLNRLELQVQALDDHPECDVVYGEVDYINGEGELIAERNMHPQVLPSGDIYDLVIKRGIFFKPGTQMIRMSVFDSVGLYDENLLVEDFDWGLRAAKKHKFYPLQAPCLLYRIHEDQFTVNPLKRRTIYESELKLIQKRFPSWDAVKIAYYRVPYWMHLVHDWSKLRLFLFLLLFPFYILHKPYLSRVRALLAEFVER